MQHEEGGFTLRAVTSRGATHMKSNLPNFFSSRWTAMNYVSLVKIGEVIHGFMVSITS
jgi:hypothetical protein